MKENALEFTKWLYDNHLVPNSSYLWFDYTKDRNSVRFLSLDVLYDIFERGDKNIWE